MLLNPIVRLSEHDRESLKRDGVFGEGLIEVNGICFFLVQN